MNDQQYRQWLDQPNEQRVMLLELEHAAGVLQVADQPYIAPIADHLDDPVYDDVLIEAVGISTRIDGLIEFGDIRLRDDGGITHWLGYQFRGYPVRAYLGGMHWSRADFRLIAVATNEGIRSWERGELVCAVTDTSSKLDTPIDTGSLELGGNPVPLVLGRCFNVPAYRISTQADTYRVSYLPLSSVQPRDNGNAAPHAKDLANGAFTLDNHPGNASTITAAAHEPHDTPMTMVAWIAAHYGLEVSPATALPEVTVGIQSSSAISGAQILEQLRDTLGAGWMIDALNRLDVRVLTAPTGEPDMTLAPDDIVDGTLELDTVEPPWSALTLRWGRNDAELRGVAATIDDTDPALAARYQRAWSESTVSQALDGHPLATPVTRDTLLQVESDVTAERDRRLAYHAERRERWRVNTYVSTVTVYQSIRVDLAPIAERIGRVIAVRPQVGGKAELEILL
ncbi:hypothetical protein QO259_10445 [Salinicola sp. JS01]|uniref:hypothetical protein n=1 Tax=Salinicola sp. JS01 TaxID=3050071 RepID=UPI00255B6464|nr:hypothetical protein [Salinicola sp. JS01]WIX31254.1 hypothetical protein QO259_10445 [Salinicola sp. JS01]